MLGRVYIIQSPNTDKVYIGSTFKTLKRRLNQHKKPTNGTTSYLVVDEGDPYIELLEEIKVIDEDELHFYEQRYLELYTDIAVNEKSAFGVDQEKKKIQSKINGKKFREKNKEYVYKKNKKYREEHPEMCYIKNQKYYEKNKDTLLEKKKELFFCPCGGKYIRTHKVRHEKSQKHQKYLENVDQDKE